MSINYHIYILLPWCHGYPQIEGSESGTQ